MSLLPVPPLEHFVPTLDVNKPSSIVTIGERMLKASLMLTSIVFSTLLLSSALGIDTQIVHAQHTPSGGGFFAVSAIAIASPLNITYTFQPILFNMSIQSFRDLTASNVTLAYSIDGGTNKSIPVESSRVPIEVEYTNPDGTITKGISVQSHYQISGTLILPELAKGSHSLTVYGTYFFPGFAQDTGLDSKTVNFLVNDGLAPVISDLSLENKTYRVSNFPISFTTNQPTSWIAFCLDGKANVTITGNTTIAGIANGPHSITFFANDTAGNMGASKSVNFIVDSLPSPDVSDTSIPDLIPFSTISAQPSSPSSPTNFPLVDWGYTLIIAVIIGVIGIVCTIAIFKSRRDERPGAFAL
jgi:hypothetical protein